MELDRTLASLDPATLADGFAAGPGGAESCEFRGDSFTCRCVDMRTERGRLRIGHLTRSGGQWRATSVRQDRADGRVIYAKRWSNSRAGPDQISQIVIVRPDPSPAALAAEVVRLDGTVRFERLTWPVEVEPAAAEACSIERPSATAGLAWKARSAAFERGNWRVEALARAQGWPYLPDFSQHEPRAVSGVLPPEAIWSDDTLDLRASYFLADWYAAPQAVVAPGRWYGLGVGLASAVDADAAGPPAPASPDGLLDVQLRWSTRPDEVRGVASGEAVWGSAYTHLSASMEEVGDPRFWVTERFRRRAPFRPWRLSRAGVALAGPEHTLSIRAFHAEPFTPLDFDAEDDILGAQLRLATRHRLGDWASADFEARHDSFLPEGEGSLHATTVQVGADRVFGSRAAVYLQPALRGWLQTVVDSRDLGLGAGTRAQLLATAEAGVALQGRWPTVTHTLRPTLLAAREITGFERGESRDITPAAPLRAREANWSMAGAALEQRLTFAGGWRADLPVAAIVDGAGLDEALDAALWLIAAPSLAAGPVEFGATVACRDACNDLVWRTDLAASAGRWRFVYQASTLTSEQARAAQWQPSWREGWSFIDSFQRLDDGDNTPDAAHLGQVEWRSGPFGALLGGRWSADDEAGVIAGSSWRFPALGWSVGAHAAWRPAMDDWGVMVGWTREL